MNTERVLLGLSFISFVLIVKASSSPYVMDVSRYPALLMFEQFSFLNDVIFNIAIGFIVSALFYFVVVYMPEQRRLMKLENQTKRNLIELMKLMMSIPASIYLLYIVGRNDVKPFNQTTPQDIMNMSKEMINSNEPILNGTDEITMIDTHYKYWCDIYNKANTVKSILISNMDDVDERFLEAIDEIMLIDLSYQIDSDRKKKVFCL